MAKNSNNAQPATRQRTGALVLPTYSLKNVAEGRSLFVKFVSELSEKPDVDQLTGEQKKDKKGAPAFLHLINVVDLDTAEVGQMVCPAIIHSALKEAGALAGRCFELVKGKSETGKATKWLVYEIAAE